MTLVINKFHMYCKLPQVYTVNLPAVAWKSPTQGALLTVHGVVYINPNSERKGKSRENQRLL